LTTPKQEFAENKRKHIIRDKLLRIFFIRSDINPRLGRIGRTYAFIITSLQKTTRAENIGISNPAKFSLALTYKKAATQI
jgi:hypothetical protein